MSTPENGLAGNIVLPTPLNIMSSVASGSACLVTTTAAHLLSNGDTVSIEGHQNNFQANGQWVATVISSTQFTIPVTVFGTGATNGTVQSLAFGTTFAIPADGVDNEDAASVNVPFEALADRTAFLLTAQSTVKSVIPYDPTSVTVDTNTVWDQFPTSGPPAVGTWLDLTGATVFTSGFVALGDVVDIEIDLNLYVSVTGAQTTLTQLSIWWGCDLGGITYARGAGSCRVREHVFAGASVEVSPMRLRTAFVPSVAPGLLRWKIMGYYVGTIPAQWALVGDYFAMVRTYRSTGIPLP